MIWIPILLNLLVVAPFAWTVFSPGNGPDGAMEASMLFFFGVAATATIWGIYGAIRLLMYVFT